jgi:hypothetical protein
MRIAVLNPSMGFRRLPLNLAIKSAIEEVFFKKTTRSIASWSQAGE